MLGCIRLPCAFFVVWRKCCLKKIAQDVKRHSFFCQDFGGSTKCPWSFYKKFLLHWPALPYFLPFKAAYFFFSLSRSFWLFDRLVDATRRGQPYVTSAVWSWRTQGQPNFRLSMGQSWLRFCKWCAHLNRPVHCEHMFIHFCAFIMFLH